MNDDVLSVNELKTMKLEEIIASSEKLPDFIDASTLNEDNFEDFKYWLDFVEPEHSIAIPQISKDITQYFTAAYFSLPFLMGAHEMLHAVGAKISGGKVYGFGINSRGAYALVGTSTKLSTSFTLVLPNFVIPILGFYLMGEGLEKKDMYYFGAGASAAVLNFGSFLVDYGDMSAAASQFVPQQYSIITGGILSLATYYAAYKIANGIRKVKHKFS